MRVKVGIFFSFFFLFLFRYVTCKVTAKNKQKNYSKEGFLNLLNKKLENLNNTVSGEVSANFNKDIELLKKEIEELQKYEKAYGAEDFDENLEDESGDGLGKKKKILGVDEDELDNYDEEFFGQSKTTMKGEDYQEDTDAQDDTDEQGETDAQDDSSGEDHHMVPGEIAEGNSPLEGTNDKGAAQKSGEFPPKETSNGKVSLDGADPHNEASNGHDAPPGEVPPYGVESTDPEVAPGKQKAPEQGFNTTNAEVQYLDNLYDDAIRETNKNNQVHNPQHHTNYDTLNKNYDFPMTSKEYDMVKMLFGDCFKMGNDENSNTVCLIDLFKKILEDKIFMKQFENFMHSIYSFAKRHNYLGHEKMKNEELYKELFNSALKLLNTF
ncbi:MSP7-like protein, putative [Plasmodium ovale]|uniref:MSP7-like protein, putative n=1 Tax=Plasmodium ovale TaxID=36330 RepID=A0A1D3TKC1_PLAOA|nr:MSP7-like protein, putative [Plasmodium ovale]